MCRQIRYRMQGLASYVAPTPSLRLFCCLLSWEQDAQCHLNEAKSRSQGIWYSDDKILGGDTEPAPEDSIKR